MAIEYKRSLSVIPLTVFAASMFTSLSTIAGQNFILADGVTIVGTEPMLDPEYAAVGSLEGGPTVTIADAGINLIINEGQQLTSGSYDIPTGAPPSPLYGSQPFSQQMLRFEEFGPQPLPTTFIQGGSFPRPLDAQNGPVGPALEAFLTQSIFPAPTRLSNVTATNPWELDIEAFIGRNLASPPAEGRPPGENWAHQRYSEFAPELYFQTAQAGARTNLGFRDAKQMHTYSQGEFGPGGLYHNTTGLTGFDGTTSGIDIRFHPNMPIQASNALWTFDGTLPPKLLSVRYGTPVVMRHYNALPVDPSANFGFGLHTITTHEHNGHTPAESDGYTSRGHGCG